MPYGMTVEQMEILAEHISEELEVDTSDVMDSLYSFTRKEVARIARNERR